MIFLSFNEQAEDALREQKLKYLQIWTLYSELKDLLIEYDIKKQDVHPSSATLQVRGLLEKWNLASLHCFVAKSGGCQCIL